MAVGAYLSLVAQVVPVLLLALIVDERLIGLYLADRDSKQLAFDRRIAICQRCRVRVLCAAYARDAGCSGVWGGVNLVEGVPRQWRRPRAE
jgi:hypothetical protein